MRRHFIIYMYIGIYAHIYTCTCVYTYMLSQAHEGIYRFWNADWFEDPEATKGEEGIPRIPGIGLVG